MVRTWAVDLYFYVVVGLSSILIILYIWTFYKAWAGTRYSFILILVCLMAIGAIGGLGSAFFMHQASLLVPDYKDNFDPVKAEQVSDYVCTSYLFNLAKDITFSVSIWCFAFRYWNISFVMLVQLKGERVTTPFKLMAIAIFLIMLSFNIIIPSLRASYAYKASSGDTAYDQMKNWAEYSSMYFLNTYFLATLQGISAVFMFWAIIRLLIASGRSLTIKELVKQKFISLHFATLSVYLAGLVMWNIIYARWDDYNLESENKVYIM